MDKEKITDKDFVFSAAELHPGCDIYLKGDPFTQATVEDETHVRYQGEIYTLCSLTKKLLHSTEAVSGIENWCYRGNTLSYLANHPSMFRGLIF